MSTVPKINSRQIVLWLDEEPPEQADIFSTRRKGILQSTVMPAQKEATIEAFIPNDALIGKSHHTWYLLSYTEEVDSRVFIIHPTKGEHGDALWNFFDAFGDISHTIGEIVYDRHRIIVVEMSTDWFVSKLHEVNRKQLKAI